MLIKLMELPVLTQLQLFVQQLRARVSIAKWNLKEAGGKRLSRRTETVYRRDGKGNVAKETKARNLHGLPSRKDSGYMNGKRIPLP